MKHYFLHLVLAIFSLVAFAQSTRKVKVPNNAVGTKVKAPNKAPIAMVYVEGGTFQMGSGLRDDERPIHTVTVSSFNMGKYEVTQKQWRDVMGNNPSYHKDCDNCPVETVSWNEVQEFLDKLNERFPGHGYRLPTEAEWEFAARGGVKNYGYTYAGGDDLGTVGWYDANSGSSTHAVGGKKPNSLGLYDMAGNVWEWCNDWYGTYPSGNVTNSKGPQAGGFRVLRGGGWGNDGVNCRSAYRCSNTPGFRYGNYGFRVVSPQ